MSRPFTLQKGIETSETDQVTLRPGLVLLVMLMGSNGHAQPTVDHKLPVPQKADFQLQVAASDVRVMTDWIVHTGDNQKMPFVVVDKMDAKVYLFNARGQIRGASAALLGIAIGDDSVPGIGQRKLSSIRPDERTTPAGRFVASLGRNLQGGQILWVDYASALSLHPVINNNIKERRAQRLGSLTPQDNRISFGCINVPADFFKNVVSPAFTQSSGVVYILPETRQLHEIFPGVAARDAP